MQMRQKLPDRDFPAATLSTEAALVLSDQLPSSLSGFQSKPENWLPSQTLLRSREQEGWSICLWEEQAALAEQPTLGV